MTFKSQRAQIKRLKGVKDSRPRKIGPLSDPYERAHRCQDFLVAEAEESGEETYEPPTVDEILAYMEEDDEDLKGELL
jgi:hypothetical protein